MACLSDDENGKCADDCDESDEKENCAIPTLHLMEWADTMAQMYAAANGGDWEYCAHMYADELGDVLHMLCRMGFQLIDCVREVDEEPVLYEVTISWRRASKSIARRFRRLTSQYHFGKLAGPKGT